MNKEQKNRRKYLLPIVNKHLGIPLLLAGKEERTMTHCLNVMMTELMKNASPEELQFSIYDRTEALPHITQASGYYRTRNTSAYEAIRELEWASKEMARRHEILSLANSRTLADYNETHRDVSLPHVVIVMNELGDLMTADAAKTEKLLVDLCVHSRKVGIYILGSTARIRRDILTPRILACFGRHLVFRMDSKEESTLLGMTGLHKIPPRLLPYRGNPESFYGHAIAEAEKHWDATRLDEDEAVFFHYASYLLGYENGRKKTMTRQERKLLRIKE